MHNLNQASSLFLFRKDRRIIAYQSKAAKNSPVTQAEVDDCHNQIFPLQGR
jgi:hypothetical protein